MLNSVILTVRVERTDLEYDMEFPADVPGGQLCEKLLAALRNIENDTFRAVEKIHLTIERTGTPLDDDQTLEQAGVWDGGIVTVVKGGW
ncbi:MAG: EsaB/YukD family protein [Clostridiales bacterium]|jgi:hypothetical protein|nr:EsaB/YukD family protein [Clostridiales bacterium]